MLLADLEGAHCAPPPSSYIQKPRTIRVKKQKYLDINQRDKEGQQYFKKIYLFLPSIDDDLYLFPVQKLFWSTFPSGKFLLSSIEKFSFQLNISNWYHSEFELLSFK